MVEVDICYYFVSVWMIEVVKVLVFYKFNIYLYIFDDIKKVLSVCLFFIMVLFFKVIDLLVRVGVFCV